MLAPLYLRRMYGEHEDGSRFDGVGIGRAWPLLTGERAHYELAAGNRAEVERLLSALEAFASAGHLMPVQIWASPDIPERESLCGRPSGSAMPLAWARAEHLKILRSFGRPGLRPPASIPRYQAARVTSPYDVWRVNHKCRRMRGAKILRVETSAATVVR